MGRNIIVAGQAGTKHHLWNGPKTMCNRRSLHKENEKDFIDMYTRAPELCCTKCVIYLQRRGKIAVTETVKGNQVMKRWIVIVQASGFNFKTLVFEAENETELYPKYRPFGMGYSILPYSTHNLKMAQLQTKQCNEVTK